jgi:hypothetical protein
MKNKYLRMLAIFFLLVAVNELFRPWVYVNNRSSGKRPAGYYIIGHKPEIKSSSEMNMMFGMKDKDMDVKYDVKYDYLVLNLQRASILALFLGVLLFFGPRSIAFRLLATVPLMFFVYFLYLLKMVAIR